MNRSAIVIGLAIAIALQLLVLSGMLITAALPLWTGNEIRVKTVPVDPRSMFRGNYAQLNYDIGQLPSNVLQDVTNLRVGEVVYVSLELAESGLHSVADASLNKPDKGTFLRGRIAGNQRPYQVKYGIEAFFAPKKKALQLERDLSSGGVAVLMVSYNGRVALSDVIPNIQVE